MYLLNSFHPPAASASIAFIIFDGTLWEMAFVFLDVIGLLTLVKVLIYAFYYEHLEMRKFIREFRKVERKVIKRRRN